MEIILIIIICFLIYLAWKYLKLPKINCTALFTGAPKTGKSTLAIATAISKTRKARRRTYFYNMVHKNKKEMPVLYSNIPIKVKYYQPLTYDIITRRKRMIYGSVVYMGEFSLVADSMEFKDKVTNEELQLFFKLFGHETKGGYLITDTQCINDCHFALKRVTSQYFYIHDTINIKLLPFIIMHVREQQYSDDKSTIQTLTEDTEETLKTIVLFKSVWKKFDCYCYSIFTDNKEVEKKEGIDIQKLNLKANKIISFKKYETLEDKFIEKRFGK